MEQSTRRRLGIIGRATGLIRPHQKGCQLSRDRRPLVRSVATAHSREREKGLSLFFSPGHISSRLVGSHTLHGLFLRHGHSLIPLSFLRIRVLFCTPLGILRVHIKHTINSKCRITPHAGVAFYDCFGRFVTAMTVITTYAEARKPAMRTHAVVSPSGRGRGRARGPGLRTESWPAARRMLRAPRRRPSPVMRTCAARQ